MDSKDAGREDGPAGENPPSSLEPIGCPPRLPLTAAGRLEIATRLMHFPVVDEAGNVIGHESLIDEETARRLLSAFSPAPAPPTSPKDR